MIGPAGEMLLFAAGIQNLDKDRIPSRIAARGGLGAVMGSKRVKAIVFDDAGGKKPPIVRREAFKAAQKLFTNNTLEHPQTKTYQEYGTPAMVRTCNAFGGLPTRNFRSGQFEGAETISGEYMRDLLLKRGRRKRTHPRLHGGVRHSVLQHLRRRGREGHRLAARVRDDRPPGVEPRYADLDTVARLNWEISDLGLDTIDMGAALGVAAEAGLMAFGDGARGLELLREVRQGTPLGRILGHGAAVAGKVLGVLRAPVVKGQAMSSYEPRAIKGTGTTYVTSPQGADHSAGNTVRAKVDHLDAKANIATSRAAHINMAGFDTLGACIFAGFGFMVKPEVIPDLLNARYGWQVGGDILQVLGRETLTVEREFNKRAGFTAADDRIPEYMRTEPLPPHNSVYDAAEADLDSIFNW